MGTKPLLDGNAFKMWKRRQTAIERIRAERLADGVDEVNAEYQARGVVSKMDFSDSEGEE